MINQLDNNGILQALASNKQQLNSFGVKEIGLFGSYARSEQNDESDIDLLVDTTRKENISQLYEACLLFRRTSGQKSRVGYQTIFKPLYWTTYTKHSSICSHHRLNF